MGRSFSGTFRPLPCIDLGITLVALSLSLFLPLPSLSSIYANLFFLLCLRVPPSIIATPLHPSPTLAAVPRSPNRRLTFPSLRLEGKISAPDIILPLPELRLRCFKPSWYVVFLQTTGGGEKLIVEADLACAQTKTIDPATLSEIHFVGDAICTGRQLFHFLSFATSDRVHISPPVRQKATNRRLTSIPFLLSTFFASPCRLSLSSRLCPLLGSSSPQGSTSGRVSDCCYGRKADARRRSAMMWFPCRNARSGRVRVEFNECYDPSLASISCVNRAREIYADHRVERRTSAAVSQKSS
jgi:hypothetical protein